MKAILIKEHGGPEQLYLGDAPEPEIKDHEIRVKVQATAINRADTLQRQGSYPPPPGESSVLGLEMAGDVDQVGAQVKKWKVGDRVFALLGGGGYAEYAAVHEDMAMPIPSNVSYEDAAGIAEVYLTAYQALTWIGKMKENQNLKLTPNLPQSN